MEKYKYNHERNPLITLSVINFLKGQESYFFSETIPVGKELTYLKVSFWTSFPNHLVRAGAKFINIHNILHK